MIGPPSLLRSRAGRTKSSRWLPPIWLVVAVCAVLVSLAVYAWPWLRTVLTASPPHRHAWWFVTALFVHADRTAIPLYLHLVTNVAVIAFFGSRAEGRLGSARTAVLVVTAVTAQLAVSRAMGTYGDGASGIAWALVPPALVGFVVQARRNGVGVLRSPAWWGAVVLVLWIWVVVTVASAQMQAHATNVWHLVATLVGVAFVIVCRRRLCADGPVPHGPWDVRVRLVALALPLLLGGILLAAATDLVPVRSPAIVAIDPPSGGIGVLDRADGRVEVRFDVPMGQGARTQSTVLSVRDEPLRVRSSWEDDHTLVLQVSRGLVEGERVRIAIDRLFDTTGRPVATPIRLVYE